MKATLQTRLNAGQPCLICPRCGFWAVFTEPYQMNIDAFSCPDCNAPLDGVEPRPKCQTN